ncbi:MAG: hypothetical protein IJM51_03905 [Clostridia bacterium]|nr:hypothetical protein [Clostridia bacterium]
MNILKTWKKKLLFGFYIFPAMQSPEMEDAGFSLRLFPNGTVIYQTYRLNSKGEPVIKESGRVTLGENTVSRIARTIAGYAKEIDALPEYTNNGSCDGNIYDFVFCGKYVSTLNIQRTDPSKVMQDNPAYYEKYRFDMADENTILDIFARITDAMKQEYTELYLHHLAVNGEMIY